MASAQNVSSLFHRGLLCMAAVAFVLTCLPATTTALPLIDVVEESMAAARADHQTHRAKRDVTKTDCAQPSNLQQMFQDLNSDISTTQFLRPAGAGGKVISIPAGEKATLMPGDPNQNKTCPNHLTRVNTAPLSHRSLCPFYFDILQLPEGYYPQTLNYAKCKCQDCVENTAFGCEPVVTQLAVLKPKGCSNGLQLYEEEVIPVHTACTCAFKGIVTEENLPYSTTTEAPSGGQEDW